jgi:hypothetical protein
MSWAEVKKALNSDLSIPLNELITNAKESLTTTMDGISTSISNAVTTINNNTNTQKNTLNTAITNSTNTTKSNIVYQSGISPYYLKTESTTGSNIYLTDRSKNILSVSGKGKLFGVAADYIKTDGVFTNLNVVVDGNSIWYQSVGGYKYAYLLCCGFENYAFFPHISTYGGEYKSFSTLPTLSGTPIYSRHSEPIVFNSSLVIKTIQASGSDNNVAIIYYAYQIF